MLFKGVRETIQNEAKEQKGGFLSMLLGKLGASLLGDMLFDKKGKRVIRAGERTVRACEGSSGSSIERSSLKNFDSATSFNKL